MVCQSMDFIAICSVKFHALKGAAEALIPLRMAAHSLAAGIGGGGGLGEKPFGTRVVVVPDTVSAGILDSL